MNIPARNFKQQAHELVEWLPETADWKDLAYEASVLQDIEEALLDNACCIIQPITQLIYSIELC